MKLSWRPLDIPYKHGHFTISAESSARARTVLLAARDGEATGFGEAAPSQRVVGADTQAVHERLEDAARRLAAVHVEATEHPPVLPWGNAKGPAACAVDGILLDLWARRHDRPLWDLMGLPRAVQPTSATVSLGTPAAMAAEARAYAEEFRVLKIKLGGRPSEDLARIQAVREAVPRVALRVDGNEGWTLDDAVSLVPAFAEAGVELIEQPLPRDVPDRDMVRLTSVCRDHDVAHVLDERVHGPEDVEAIGHGGLADGINLKLQKAGGLRNGLRVIETARVHGLRVMVGCFIETWSGIALALQVAGMVDWVDLDGAWLLADEPLVPEGASFLQDGVLRASDAPGLGVRPAPGYAPVFDEPTTSL